MAVEQSKVDAQTNQNHTLCDFSALQQAQRGVAMYRIHIHVHVHIQVLWRILEHCLRKPFALLFGLASFLRFLCRF